MQGFWDGFEKRSSSRSPLSGLLHAVGSGTKAMKKINKRQAESYADIAHEIKNFQEKHPWRSTLDPEAPGLVEELITRGKRRYHASKAESPFLTSMMPAYGVLRGGKAGTGMGRGKKTLLAGGALAGGAGAAGYAAHKIKSEHGKK